jgi:hypothetical protein
MAVKKSAGRRSSDGSAICIMAGVRHGRVKQSGVIESNVKGGSRQGRRIRTIHKGTTTLELGLLLLLCSE